MAFAEIESSRKNVSIVPRTQNPTWQHSGSTNLFEFDTKENNWMCMYGQLYSYTEKYGSTSVPFRLNKNPSRGEVRTEQNGCKKKERVKRLDYIGFVWGTRK